LVVLKKRNRGGAAAINLHSCGFWKNEFEDAVRKEEKDGGKVGIYTFADDVLSAYGERDWIEKSKDIDRFFGLFGDLEHSTKHLIATKTGSFCIGILRI
jgi:hypothetical protein